MERLKSNSVDETHAVAARLATLLSAGDVIGLSGPLGSGKTEFVRGFLGDASAQVASPSYVLEHQYELTQPLGYQLVQHWDLFRLGAGVELGELVEPDAVALVEWPEKVAPVAEVLDVIIEFVFGDSEASRVLNFKAKTNRGKNILSKLGKL